MRIILHLFLIFLFNVGLLSVSNAQTISIGSLQDEQIRLQTLKFDSLNSFVISRPYTFKNNQEPISSNSLINKNLSGSIINKNDYFQIGLHPIFIQNTFNSRLPFSENNNAAWYGRGNTTELLTGIFIHSDYITVNLQPHIIFQKNKDFLHPRFISRDSDGNIRFIAEGVQDGMDAPFRFGPDPYTTFDWGYSSIRFHYNEFETGLSTEPLWWGPAVRYPLVMSNNAPGFKHFFLGTRERVKIPYLGAFQLRWILGYPKESEYFDGTGQGETRFTNAVNVAYSPPFFENLTVGIIRLFHLFETNGFEFSNVTRIFDPFSRSRLVSTQGDDGVRQDRNQLASFYAHLLLPEARAEIYAEFYKEDHSYDLRDLINQPHHNSAYTIGFQKISDFPWVDFINTNVEITNLTHTALRQVRVQSFFYTHSRIRQGHTNRGQVLGAAIGPGSNSQLLNIDAYKNEYKLGLFIQRYVDNDSFHFREGSASNALSANFGDYFRHRVNLNLGLNFLYGPGPFYINSRVVWTKAYNYGRFDYGRLDGINATNYDRNDRTNVQFQIGITYIL